MVVTFDSLQLARDYGTAKKISWPMLLDGDQTLYRAYGFPKASWWDLLKPLVTWKYIVNMLTGHLPGTPGKDLRQLGGDVLISPDGMVVLNHVSDDPHDRPDCDQLFELVAAAR